MGASTASASVGINRPVPPDGCVSVVFFLGPVVPEEESSTDNLATDASVRGQPSRSCFFAVKADSRVACSGPPPEADQMVVANRS